YIGKGPPLPGWPLSTRSMPLSYRRCAPRQCPPVAPLSLRGVVHLNLLGEGAVVVVHKAHLARLQLVVRRLKDLVPRLPVLGDVARQYIPLRREAEVAARQGVVAVSIVGGIRTHHIVVNAQAIDPR